MKRTVALVATAQANHVRMGINTNGSELVDGNAMHTAALWTQQDGLQPDFLGMGDALADPDIYDQNRLAAVKIRWFPTFPGGALTNAAYAPMAVVYDRDGIEGNVLTQGVPSLMEQVNGVKLYNMYQPWSRYIKFPKFSLNTRIPSLNPASTTADPIESVAGYRPNQNLAGQWKRNSYFLSQTFIRSGSSPDYVYAPISRANHLLVACLAPATSQEGQIPCGTLQLTSYYVYKDRR